jgi:hypothetical protein
MRTADSAVGGSPSRVFRMQLAVRVTAAIPYSPWPPGPTRQLGHAHVTPRFAVLCLHLSVALSCSAGVVSQRPRLPPEPLVPLTGVSQRLERPGGGERRSEMRPHRRGSRQTLALCLRCASSVGPPIHGFVDSLAHMYK